MNYELLMEIIKELSYMQPLKAKRLNSLAGKHFIEKNEDKKNNIERKIYNIIYNTFISCLDKDLRDEYYSTNLSINSICHSIEHNEAKENCQLWHIYHDGARRFELVNGDYGKQVNFIPREYQKGFCIQDRCIITKEVRDEIAIEKKFVNRHKIGLNNISKLYDYKQELLSGDYKLKNPYIPRDFVELLISYLGLPRLPEKDNTKIK